MRQGKLYQSQQLGAFYSIIISEPLVRKIGGWWQMVISSWLTAQGAQLIRTQYYSSYPRPWTLGVTRLFIIKIMMSDLCFVFCFTHSPILLFHDYALYLNSFMLNLILVFIEYWQIYFLKYNGWIMFYILYFGLYNEGLTN